MFFLKASDPVEEATVVEVTVVVEAIQDQPEAARQGLTAVHQYAQAPEQLGKAPAEATAVAALAHHGRAQPGRAVPYDKDRAQ